MLILLLTLTISLTHAQQIQSKTITMSCLCDVSDGCDYECCCDAECTTAALREAWDSTDKCADDGFGIPLCESIDEEDVHVDDLYSGINTIYKIVKRLFCLEREQGVDSASFYQVVTNSTDSDFVTEAVEAEYSEEELSATPTSLQSLTNQVLTGAFYADGTGRCQVTNRIRQKVSTGLQTCRQYIVAEGSFTSSPVLDATQFLAAFGSTINVYQMSEPSSATPTTSTLASVSCSGGVCQNVIRYVHIFMTDNNTISTTHSYIVVGDVTYTSNSYVSVQYQYQYMSQESVFGLGSNQGYTMGAPIRLLFEDSSNSKYYRINNPINLAYRQTDGACRTDSTDNADDSLLQLLFGHDGMYTCVGGTSFIQEHLQNSFNYVGAFGSATTVLADYVSVSWPSSIENTRSLQLLLYYVKVGEESNYQYQITNVTASTLSTQNSQSTLYVEYIEVENTAELYIPSPPTIEASLPDDFLYPFYVAS